MQRLCKACLPLLSALLGACSLLPPAAPPPEPVCEVPLLPAALPAPKTPDVDALSAVLAYAAELRTRPAAELARDLPRDGEPLSAVQAMRRALLLSQGRSAAELTQAQAAFEQVGAGSDASAQALKPLAALLATRIAEQRKLQDNLDKLTQQLRDSQRRNEQLNEKLEALKAIEHKLPPAGSVGR